MSQYQRFAFITGASSGLGRALALRLAADRWHIGIADVDAAGAEETRRQVERAGGTAEFIPLDIRDDDVWPRVRDDLRRRWPQLDLLVNNAGVLVTGDVLDTPMDDWDRIHSINVRGAIVGCRTMLDWLLENPRRAYILNVSSIAGLLPTPGLGAYCVAKAALVSFTEVLFLELRGRNIGVTVACPWFVQTNLLKRGVFFDETSRGLAAELMATTTVSPERFAREALRATFRNKLCKVVGRRATALAWVKANMRQTFLKFTQWIVSLERRWQAARAARAELGSASSALGNRADDELSLEDGRSLAIEEAAA